MTRVALARVRVIAVKILMLIGMTGMYRVMAIDAVGVTRQKHRGCQE